MSEPGKQTIIVPPFKLNLKNVDVTILEVYKSRLVSGDTIYHAVALMEYKGVATKQFTIDGKTMDEIMSKLRAEATKLKILVLEMGPEKARRLVS